MQTSTVRSWLCGCPPLYAFPIPENEETRPKSPFCGLKWDAFQVVPEHILGVLVSGPGTATGRWTALLPVLLCGRNTSARATALALCRALALRQAEACDMPEGGAGSAGTACPKQARAVPVWRTEGT